MLRELTTVAAALVAFAGCATVLPSKLSAGDVLGVIADHKEGFARCIREQWERAPGLTGTVAMRWNVFPDGSTGGVSVQTATYLGTPLGDCLSGEIGQLRFPRYSGPQMGPGRLPGQVLTRTIRTATRAGWCRRPSSAARTPAERGPPKGSRVPSPRPRSRGGARA